MEKNRFLRNGILTGLAGFSILSSAGCEAFGINDSHTFAKSDVSFTLEYPRGWQVIDSNEGSLLVNKDIGSVEIQSKPHMGSLTPDQVENELNKEYEKGIAEGRVDIKVNPDVIGSREVIRYEIERREVGGGIYKDVNSTFLLNGVRYTISYSLDISDAKTSPSRIKKMEKVVNSIEINNH